MRDEGDMFDAEVGEERGDGFEEDGEAGIERDGRRGTETGSEWLISLVVEVVVGLHARRKSGGKII